MRTKLEKDEGKERCQEEAGSRWVRFDGQQRVADMKE